VEHLTRVHIMGRLLVLPASIRLTNTLAYGCMGIMEQCILKNVNNCLITNIFSYLETSGGKSYNIYLNVVHFFQKVLIRHLWQPKTIVLLHWCLICAVPLRP
jgi:hypothetical protein